MRSCRFSIWSPASSSQGLKQIWNPFKDLNDLQWSAMRHNSSVFLTVAITMERHHAYCRPTQVGNKEAKVSASDKSPIFGTSNLEIWSPKFGTFIGPTLKTKRQQSMIYILCSTTWRETRGAWARDLPFMFALLFSQPWFWTFPGTFSYFNIWFLILIFNTNIFLFLLFKYQLDRYFSNTCFFCAKYSRQCVKK